MKITTGDAHNTFFTMTLYDVAPDCQGRVYKPKYPGSVLISHELWNGERSLAVPKEVFDLWVYTCELVLEQGKELGIELGIEIELEERASQKERE